MKRIFLILLLAYAETLSGQAVSKDGPDPTTLPEVIPPSPTVASLMRFEEIPVDYHTGQPSIAIPIFNKSVAKNLNIDLSLRYSTSGVKVNENSSWVGTGWSMQVGGAISRTVRGLPDEFDGVTNGRARGRGVLHLDEFWRYDNLSNDEKIRFNWKALGTSVDKYDTDLDLYQFSFPGGTGRFVMEKYSGTLKARLISKDQLVKIDLIDWNRQTYELYAFKITDTNGYQYTFDMVETSLAKFRNFSVSQNGEGNLSGDAHLGDYHFNSAWHLTQISSPNGLFLVGIEYVESFETYNVSKTFTTNEITPAFPSGVMRNPHNNTVFKPARSVSVFNMHTQSWKPSIVNFRDGTHLELIADELQPHPETGGSRLKEVRIYDGSSTDHLRAIVLQSNDVNGRMWLNEVIDMADQKTKSYSLKYTDNDRFPGHSEINDMGPVDDWGYFLPTHGADSRSGLLERIIFPTGGSQEYIFEPHTIEFIGPDAVTDDNSNTNNTQSANIDISGSYVPAFDGLITEFNIADIPHTQKIQVSFNKLQGSISGGRGLLLGDGGNTNVLANMQLTLIDAEGSILSRLNLNQTTAVSVQVPIGRLSAKIHTLSQGTHTLSGSLSFIYEIPGTGTGPSSGTVIGGFRIGQILFKDDPNSIAHEREFQFTYKEGAIDALKGNLSREDIIRTEKFIFGSEEISRGSYNRRRIDYLSKTQGTVNAHMTKGGHVGYGLVRVEEPGNGYTEYNFTTAKDYPSPRESFHHPYPSPPDQDYKRGVLRSQRVYDNSDRILQESINEYNFVAPEVVATSLRISDLESCGWSTLYNTYSGYFNKEPAAGRIPICPDGLPCLLIGFENCGVPPSHVSTQKDHLTFGWAQKESTTTREYFYNKFGDQSLIESKQYFDYNDLNYQVHTSENILREGGVDVSYKTQYYYPVGPGPELDDGYEDMSAAVSSLQDQNRLTTLLYTKSYRDKILLSRAKSLYSNFTISNSETTTPYVTQLKEVQTAIGTHPLEPRLTFHAYDVHSNILEVSKTNNIKVNYLWGYSGSLPVAKIENGDRNIISSVINQNTLNTGDNTQLIQELNKLRSSRLMTGSIVTTYTYDLLKGLSTMTDPNGYSTHYQYDNSSRLIKVKDFEENVLKQFEYHLDNQ